MIQHIVLLKLKPETTAEQKAALLEGLGALKRENKIPGIEEVTGGDNNSPEGKAHGFDWGFVMTFTDAAARDAYAAWRQVLATMIAPSDPDDARAQRLASLAISALEGALIQARVARDPAPIQDACAQVATLIDVS